MSNWNSESIMSLISMTSEQLLTTETRENHKDLTSKGAAVEAATMVNVSKSH